MGASCTKASVSSVPPTERNEAESCPNKGVQEKQEAEHVNKQEKKEQEVAENSTTAETPSSSISDCNNCVDNNSDDNMAKNTQNKLGDVSSHLETTPEDKELLDLAKKNMQPTQVTNILATTKPQGYIYLMYNNDKNGGLLNQYWSHERIEQKEEKEQQDIKENVGIVVATIVPAFHKTIPKTKFDKGGKTEILKDVNVKWNSWGKSDKAKYYKEIANFFKLCEGYDGELSFSDCFQDSGSPPSAHLFFLVTSAVGNKVRSETLEGEKNFKDVTLVGVVPKDKGKILKDGLDISEAKFSQTILDEGGTVMQLTKKVSDALSGQNDVKEWLGKDGIEISNENGITMDKDQAKTYERARC